MTALPFISGVIKIRVTGTNQGSPVAHILHATFTGGTPSVTDCQTIATGIRSAWNTNVIPVVGTSVVYNLWEVTDLSLATGAVGANTTSLTGTHPSTQPVPASLCVGWSWKVARHYRGGHSRTYIPFANGADLVNGKTIGSTYLALNQTNSAAFLTAVNAVVSGPISITMALLSYYTGHALRPIPHIDPVIAALVHPRADSQRRRLGKEVP